jgi:hypothetical protein
MRVTLALVCLGLWATALRAQGLPAFTPINPVATSRSGLGFEPYHDPAGARWVLSGGIDYASTIESNELPGATYWLDAELLRIDLHARRDIGPRSFVFAAGQLLGAYGGFLDGFLDWYHGLIGIEMPERKSRPRDEFLYSVRPPSGWLVTGRSDLFLGDTRIGAGLRWTPHLQSVVALTLPTSTGPDGYGRGVLSLSLLNTVRAPITPRLIYEGSLSVGHTPPHGSLARHQHETMVAASSGLRLGVWGRHGVFGNLFYHSPYYEGTTLPSLDRRELSFDFGLVLARKGGGEWRVGMTEDFEPGGPAIDLIFRVGGDF